MSALTPTIACPQATNSLRGRADDDVLQMHRVWHALARRLSPKRRGTLPFYRSMLSCVYTSCENSISRREHSLCDHTNLSGWLFITHTHRKSIDPRPRDVSRSRQLATPNPRDQQITVTRRCYGAHPARPTTESGLRLGGTTGRRAGRDQYAAEAPLLSARGWKPPRHQATSLSLPAAHCGGLYTPGSSSRRWRPHGVSPGRGQRWNWRRGRGSRGRATTQTEAARRCRQHPDRWLQPHGAGAL